MVFFLHTPKCAGTSFYEFVRRNHGIFLKPKVIAELGEVANLHVGQANTAIRLPGGYGDAARVVKEIIELDPETQTSINFIGGHVGHGFHELSSCEVDYISFVRDPRLRVVSDFQEHCKEGRHFYDDLARKGFQINDYLQLLLDNHLDNFFTRQITGPYDFFLKDRMEISNSDIDKAISNGKKVRFFPVTHYNEALFYFREQFGWNRLYFKKKNVAVKINEPLDYDPELMKRVTKFDYQLMGEIQYEKVSSLNWWQKVMVRFG